MVVFSPVDSITNKEQELNKIFDKLGGDGNVRPPAQLNIKLDPEIHRRFQDACRTHGEKMSPVVVDLIEQYISSQNGTVLDHPADPQEAAVVAWIRRLYQTCGPEVRSLVNTIATMSESTTTEQAAKQKSSVTQSSEPDPQESQAIIWFRRVYHMCGSEVRSLVNTIATMSNAAAKERSSPATGKH